MKKGTWIFGILIWFFSVFATWFITSNHYEYEIQILENDKVFLESQNLRLQSRLEDKINLWITEDTLFYHPKDHYLLWPDEEEEEEIEPLWK